MHRLLIADTGGGFGKIVEEQLKNEFETQICHDGQKALELLRRFEPDILLLDLQLPVVDGLAVLRTIRATNMYTRVVVISSLTADYICRELEQLQVCGLFRKPCMVGSVVSCIRDLGLNLQTSLADDWCVECEIDRILLDLGFRMGKIKYSLVHAALMYVYEDPDCYVTKCLYPVVAKRFGGTTTQVEKAIRDAIKVARANGNKQIWQMYFPPGRDERNTSLTNEFFLKRICSVLLTKSRLKKPYQEQIENVQ